LEGIILTLNGDWNKEYNISGDEEVLVFDLARFIIKETGSESKIAIRDGELAQPQKVNLDLSEIKKLGYVPKVGLWEGVRKNIDFLKRN